jgi:hypothetical protein
MSLTPVLTPTALARRYRTYYYRVLMGPSCRADMWAALEREPTLSATELARQTYGSFASAWQVKHDWTVLAATRVSCSRRDTARVPDW